MTSGSAISVPQRAPASPCALDSVRRIARCGSSARWRARLCVLANSRYASSTTSSARPASLPAMRTIVGSSSRFPLGLFGEHRNTSLTSAVHCSSTARSSRANPAAARSGTVATCAPWMRAATAYMANVGGHTSTASRPARQNARTRRSIASSLPRPARIDSGAAPYSAASRSMSVRGCGSGYRFRPASDSSPGARHGNSLACSRSSRGSHAACS